MPTPGPDPPSEPHEFERWLRAACRGSVEDRGRVLEACRAHLMLLAEAELGSTLRPKAGASDLVQESMLDAHRGFDAFRGTSRGELLAWLGRIVRTNMADLARRYRNATCRSVERETLLPSTPLPDPRADLSERLVAEELGDRVRAAVAGLPAEARAVLGWRHQDGLGWEEIGGRLGKSGEAARKIWFRAVERLRQVLGADCDSSG